MEYKLQIVPTVPEHILWSEVYRENEKEKEEIHELC